MKRLKNALLVALLLVTTLQVAAQDVVWSQMTKKVGDNLFEVIFKAEIDEGYYMYDMGPYVGGPNPTSFTFSLSDGVEAVGAVEPLTKAKVAYDEIFAMDIGKYTLEAQFAQKFRVMTPNATILATVEWMVCDDTSCTPPTEEDITISFGEGASEGATTKSVEQETITATKSAPAAPTKGGSLWALIIEAMLWGFAALLTPCVFPMVPMTVSFFMKGEGGVARGRVRAALYGIFIVALYTLPIAGIILITRVLGGDSVTADIFNWLATHWLPNVIFFIVFMVFAASFFGAFEITMPSWMVNKSDSRADSKGLVGIFFMAMTLVLVSFSCTGPIVGSVLIKSTSGEFWSPIVTMVAFSTAFALPFTIFALFPSLLKKMPRSGGWMNSVKVVLGFLEVALGLKFLSVADQTYHWGLLDREVYLAVWIVTFSLLGLYLLGKLRFAHDDERPTLSVGRLAAAIVTLSFVVYLIPGMFGAPLKALSGYLPPMHTQDFIIGQQGTGLSTNESSGLKTIDGKAPLYSDFLHLPHNLKGFFDIAEAEAYAASVGKPLFVDFTGHGCVNCREMEARVWSAPEVLEILSRDYVVVALYSDDKKVVPDKQWVTMPNGKVLKSLGKINSYYARTRFGANAQPYYIILNDKGEELVTPRGYDLDVAAFVAFLQDGVKAYKEGQM